jgi:hypothetical protein
MATDAGQAGRANEDFIGAVPGAVVLLDGAGIQGSESICFHGVAWYTHRLGGALLGRLSRDDGQDLAAVLAAAIDEIAADHHDTCDITDPSSPQSTVLMIRVAEERLDYLLLADSFLVLDLADLGPHVLTDEREVAARRICTEPLRGVSNGTPDLNGVALLSNGASRIVSPYGVTDWPGVLDLLRTRGPTEVIRRVRQAEAGTAAGPEARVPDDATVAWMGPMTLARA